MSKCSFKSLFEVRLDCGAEDKQTIKKVVIPRIQRDYAQGRKEADELNNQGKRFIDNIFFHLKEGSPMDMDFIYGATEKGTFTPLDGQQRLTTLYLLYWYIGHRELEEKSDLFPLLKRFSYETRATARQFCERLSSGLELDFAKDNTISEQLKDFSWFSKLYDLDPTVVAMINMLDEIHEQYSDLNQPCYEKLEQFTFTLLPLERFHLTDELYIKMNARGKQLTSFENFKADLTGWVKKHRGFVELREYNSIEMPHHMVFSNKLDNEWTDALWKISTQMADKPSMDEVFLSLFYRWFLFEYILESNISNDKIGDEPDFEYFEAESDYADFKPFDNLLTEERIERLERALDLFSEHYPCILEASRPSWQKDDTLAFFLLDKKITLPERVVLYGVWCYLDKNANFDETKFKQWMRVIRNIVEITGIDDKPSAIRTMKLVHKLGDYSDDIYGKFPEDLSKESNAAAASQEYRKTLFIRKDPSWEKSFIEAEKHPFFRGDIDFMIEDGMTLEEFKHRTEIANKVFGAEGVSEEYRKEHLLLRAIISRYSSFEQLTDLGYFTDTKEEYHYLKKMLRIDEVARKSLRSWLSVENEHELKEELNQAVAEPSQMDNSSSDNSSSPFKTKMHEELYKEPGLQEWMQERKATRFHRHYSSGSYFVSRYASWYDWVMLDSYRDEMINALVEQYALEQPNSIEGTKYHWGGDIWVKRPVELCDLTVSFWYYFYRDGTLWVGVREGDAGNDRLRSVPFNEEYKESRWVCQKKYNYKGVTDPSAVEAFLDRIEREVFDPNESSSLVGKIYNSFES